MKSFLAMFAVILIANTTLARPVKLWTHQELFTNAEVVAILTVDSISASTTTNASNPNAGVYSNYIAHCRVLSVFKGDNTLANLDIPFFQHPTGMPTFNGPITAPFTARRIIDYLVYLKRDANGVWVAAGGSYDAGLSIRTIKHTVDFRDLRLPSEGTIESN